MPTLQHIRIKVRRLTRSPSTAQLTDGQIDDYINTFVAYDFPEVVINKTLSFYTIPNVDTYATNTAVNTDPLYHFKNSYISVHPPVYIDGNVARMSGSTAEFYANWPKVPQTYSIGTGDGVTVAFNGILNGIPVLARTVSFSTVGVNGIPLIAHDIPTIDGLTGKELTTGHLYAPNVTDINLSIGNINYITGEYVINFPVPPRDGSKITFSGYVYAAGCPTMILYADNTFTVRPIPDKSYRIDIDAYKKPTVLINNGDQPDLGQWWQYIAYGAAKKVFEDRMDTESIEAIAPEFKNQYDFILRKIVLDLSLQRTSTIYVTGCPLSER